MQNPRDYIFDSLKIKTSIEQRDRLSSYDEETLREADDRLAKKIGISNPFGYFLKICDTVSREPKKEEAKKVGGIHNEPDKTERVLPTRTAVVEDIDYILQQILFFEDKLANWDTYPDTERWELLGIGRKWTEKVLCNWIMKANHYKDGQATIRYEDVKHRSTQPCTCQTSGRCIYPTR